MACYCNIIVTFGFQSVICLSKRCFDLAKNCNLSRSGAGEGTVVERAALKDKEDFLRDRG